MSQPAFPMGENEWSFYVSNQGCPKQFLPLCNSNNNHRHRLMMTACDDGHANIHTAGSVQSHSNNDIYGRFTSQSGPHTFFGTLRNPNLPGTSPTSTLIQNLFLNLSEQFLSRGLTKRPFHQPCDRAFASVLTVLTHFQLCFVLPFVLPF